MIIINDAIIIINEIQGEPDNGWRGDVEMRLRQMFPSSSQETISAVSEFKLRVGR